MVAPNEMVWYKWFPAKCLTSARWLSLTLEQEGFYRRVYDLASLAQPASRRGWLYEHNRPMTLPELWRLLRIHPNKGRAILKYLVSIGLMAQDENGAWGFPNFHKHQRTSNLRPRNDGLGSAEAAKLSAQNRRKIGAIEVQSTEVQSTEVQSTDSCAESAKTPTSAPAPGAIPDELRGLQLYEQDVKLCAKLPGVLAGWKAAFPGVDIAAEIRKAHAWELANPERRKVNRIRFLNSWLARAQDSLGRTTASGASPAQNTADEARQKTGLDEEMDLWEKRMRRLYPFAFQKPATQERTT